STSTTASSTAGGTANVDGIQADSDFYAKADLSALKGKKIGITIQSLENVYWAGVMSALEDVLKANGADYNIVSCEDNSTKQISQIENFISAGDDLIMVHPSDADAVEDACKEAQDKGIKVMCWDDPMENTDADWILNNTDLGVAIGELAGDFINEHYDETNKAQVALIDYPSTKVLLERGNGIKKGLENVASGKYELIAEQNGLEANEAQTSMETILQQYPDCKVVVGVGAGAMVGSNEALTTAVNGKIPDDMGVFTTDVTKQQLEEIQDPNQAARGIIGFEGSDEDTANACASMFAMILDGSLTNKYVYRQTSKIDSSNIDEIMKGMKG
ncbi:MAG: sugar ABC transporter substrate-binding protein, partial [Lachnospiraceae bacterium]|nr:sugar ABC transporter substrate-binding protein [Lachnospiraceae bacterium]